MSDQVVPSKSSLLRLTKSLKVAEEGYSLLDKKRNVLIHKLMGMADQARQAQEDFFAAYEEAYAALAVALVTLGSERLTEITLAAAEPLNPKILKKSVMGISIPSVESIPERLDPKLSLIDTNPAVDEAMRKFKRALSASLIMAEIETAVVKIAQEIKKTRKKANALDYILIPRYSALIKSITASLEEKDREDLFKVKIVKKRKA